MNLYKCVVCNAGATKICVSSGLHLVLLMMQKKILLKPCSRPTMCHAGATIKGCMRIGLRLLSLKIQGPKYTKA